MKINNISKFMAAAAIVVTGFCNAAEKESVVIDKSTTSPMFQGFSEPVSAFSRMKALNLSGEPVVIMPGNAIQASDQNKTKKTYGENFAMTGFYHGNSACIIFSDVDLDQGSLHPFFDSDGTLKAVMDRKAYMFYITAHEMTHCLNHDYKNMGKFVVAAKDPSLAGYSAPLGILDTAIREVHADLNAVLMGASVTGDWSLLINAALPLRTTAYDPSHATTNALTSIINTVNPKHLEGKSFEEVSAISNELFRKNFMDTDDQVDPRSKGAKLIMKEWYAMGLEAEAYLRNQKPPVEQMTRDALQAIQLIRGFSSRMMPEEELKNRGDINFVYALKKSSLEKQVHIAEKMQTGPVVNIDNLAGHHKRISKALDVIAKIYDHRNYGSGPTIEASQDRINQWQSYFNNEDKMDRFVEALPGLLSNGMALPEDDRYIDSYRESENRIRNLIAEIKDNDVLPLDHRVAAAKQNVQPSVRNDREKAGSLKDILPFSR